tara:strand:- start:454 stop:783 length:330 start_codon:yes stop_codon:yes gene_type:complete
MNKSKSNLPTGKRIFSDVTAVSRGSAISLAQSGVTDDNSVVVPWVYLNRFLRDRLLTEKESKELILLELYRSDNEATRTDIVYRLTNYLTSIDREKVRSKIKKETGIEI